MSHVNNTVHKTQPRGIPSPTCDVHPQSARFSAIKYTTKEKKKLTSPFLTRPEAREKPRSCSSREGVRRKRLVGIQNTCINTRTGIKQEHSRLPSGLLLTAAVANHAPLQKSSTSQNDGGHHQRTINSLCGGNAIFAAWMSSTAVSSAAQPSPARRAVFRAIRSRGDRLKTANSL